MTSPSLLVRPARHDRSSPRTTDLPPVPAFPWRLHVHNPRPAPAAPDPWRDECQIRDQTPVAWATQCRNCWGFVDDPRHLTPMPRKPLERR